MVIRYTIIYAFFFGLMAIANQYNVWLSLPPASIHQWRQADGAAIAWHYAQHPDFTDVRICNLFYTGDNHAAGELPLLYWMSGLISHYWGWPAYPLRWIGLILLFCGGWAFGWTILQLCRRPLLAALGAGLLLTVPILSYYGPGFLPDAPAFCFILMMMACLFQADERQSNWWLLAAASCAALAVLLKLSMAILPVALALSWGLSQRRRRQWLTSTLWNSRWPLVAIVVATAAVLGGRWWIAQYNTAHHAIYFLASTRPVWHYDWPFIRETLILIGTQELPVYASAGVYLACLGSLWISVKSWKPTPVWMRRVIGFIALGSVVYMLLWFRMLREHDYYFICLLVVPVVLLLNGFRLVQAQFAGKHIVFTLALCWLLGMAHNQHILSKRLDLAFHPPTSENLPPDAFLPPRRLAETGIPASARVLCPQDPSPNIALLALQLPGWTAYNFGDRINGDTLRKYQTNFGLTHLALRDTAEYSPLYRRFFPVRVWAGDSGWYVYAR